MGRIDAGVLAVDDQSNDGLSDLYVESLRMQIGAVLGVALVVALICGASLPETSWQPIPTLVGMALTAGIAYRLLRVRPGLATATLIVGLTATLAVEVLHHPGDLLAGYFALIVLAASGA